MGCCQRYPVKVCTSFLDILILGPYGALRLANVVLVEDVRLCYPVRISNRLDYRRS